MIFSIISLINVILAVAVPLQCEPAALVGFGDSVTKYKWKGEYRKKKQHNKRH